MQIRKTSQGKDIFLIHGWCANTDCWQRISADLSRRYRLTVAELPGHGQNIGGHYSLAQPETLVDHWLTTAPDDAVWLGWSLGGLLAQMAANRAPERVQKLISLSMGARFTQAADWPFGIMPSAVKRIRAALHKNPAQCLQSFIKQQTDGDEHAEAILPLLQTMIDTPFELEELDAGLTLLETLDLRASISQRKLPVLFIAGTGDLISNKNNLQASAELAAQGQYAEIADAGHAPLLSHPETLIHLIEDFLQY